MESKQFTLKAKTPKNQAILNRTIKALVRYNNLNNQRDKADDSGDEKLYRKLNKQCEVAFDKYLELADELPKYEKDRLENSDVYLHYAKGGKMKKGKKEPMIVRSYFEDEAIDYAKGGKLSESQLKYIQKEFEENEDNNAHSENVVLLAKYFGSSTDLKEAKKILALHEKEGYLSTENGKKRRKLEDKLFSAWNKAKGFKFANGGSVASFRIIPYKKIDNTNLIEAYYSSAYTITGSISDANESAEKYIKTNPEIEEIRIMKIHPSGNPLKHKIVSTITKNGNSKFAKGGEVDLSGNNYRVLFTKKDSDIVYGEEIYAKSENEARKKFNNKHKGKGRTIEYISTPSAYYSDGGMTTGWCYSIGGL